MIPPFLEATVYHPSSETSRKRAKNQRENNEECVPVLGPTDRTAFPSNQRPGLQRVGQGPCKPALGSHTRASRRSTQYASKQAATHPPSPIIPYFLPPTLSRHPGSRTLVVIGPTRLSFQREYFVKVRPTKKKKQQPPAFPVATRSGHYFLNQKMSILLPTRIPDHLPAYPSSCTDIKAAWAKCLWTEQVHSRGLFQNDQPRPRSWFLPSFADRSLHPVFGYTDFHL